MDIGDKIICVDDSPGRYVGPALKKGHIYTIRSIYDITDNISGTGVTLEEFGENDGYYMWRFAPIKSEFISIEFTKVTEKEKELTCVN